MDAFQPELLLDWPTEHCAVLTLNRPHAMNALSMSLRQELVSTLKRLAENHNVRVIVLTGEGRAFCAGVDVREKTEFPLGWNSLETDPINALAHFPVPVVGAINGSAMTGGLELMLACDITVASSEAVFSDTHAKVSVIPGWGLSQRLSRLVGVNRAKEMSFSARKVSAQEAERWGLVNRVVDPSRVLAESLELAYQISEHSEPMLRRYKQVISDGYETSLREGLANEASESREWIRAGLRPNPDAVLKRPAETQENRPAAQAVGGERAPSKAVFDAGSGWPGTVAVIPDAHPLACLCSECMRDTQVTA